jgi:hypothetical protein
MSRPTEIAIIGQPFYVQFVPSGSELLPANQTGRTRINHLQMYVDSTIPLPQQRVTTLHEVLHAVIAMLGLIAGDDAETVEERVVEQIATPLLDVLRSNPELTEWLTA